MNILISMPDVRQIKNLLFTSFAKELTENSSNKYYILVKKNYIQQLSRQFPKSNVTFLPFIEPSKLHKKAFALFYKIYELSCFLTKKSIDHSIFYNRLKQYNKKLWWTSLIGYSVGKLMSKSLKIFIFKRIFCMKKYKGLNIDKVLFTSYHNIYEWQILASLQVENIYFFTDGWDAFTKQTEYFVQPKKTFVWTEGMKQSALQNCNMTDDNVYVTGNPFWNILNNKKETNLGKVNVLAFDTNLNVYNIVTILNEIQSLNHKEELFELSIRCSPINSPEYKIKYEKFNKILPTCNLLFTDDWGNNNIEISKNSLIETYNNQLNSNDIFLVFGPTTVILDILQLNKPVIILAIKGEDITKWDWTTLLDREVLNEIKQNPLVKILNSLDAFNQTVIEMTNLVKFDNVSTKEDYGKKVFQELIN